jgi:hypothetical protein
VARGGAVRGRARESTRLFARKKKRPDRSVTFRNLGWSADTPGGSSRNGRRIGSTLAASFQDRPEPPPSTFCAKPGLEPAGHVGTFPHVSTVTEIEHAIERLPDAEVARLAAWLAAYRNRRTPDGNSTHHDLDTLIGSWREDPAFDAAILAFDHVDAEVWK